MSLKKSLIIGATVASVGLAGVVGVGMASAADSTSGQTSIVDKLATKFNLKKEDVQAVFDENHKEHMAQMQQKQADRLAQAVKNGKLTQEQADHIAAAKKEIQTLMGDSKPGRLDDSKHQAIKDKMDALRKWAQDNKVDMRYVGPGGFGRGHHGGGHGMMMHGDGAGDAPAGI